MMQEMTKLDVSSDLLAPTPEVLSCMVSALWKVFSSRMWKMLAKKSQRRHAERAQWRVPKVGTVVKECLIGNSSQSLKGVELVQADV